jgi:hypothetical protein
MDWDSEKCLELIGLYEKKAELWQPDHKHHYNKLILMALKFGKGT